MLSQRQQQCLSGMGITQWRERALLPVVETASEAAAADTSPQQIESVEALIQQAIGPIINQRAAPETAAETSAETSAETTPEKTSSPPPRLDSWDAIIESIHACSACELAKNCTQKVPGVGDRSAKLLIVGEGPGHDEDISGEPFVGRSGQLLDRMLAAIGVQREQIYITNIVKCRPPDNRDPKQDEASQCRAFLMAQIEQIKPAVILSAGRVSAHHLLETSQPVGKLIKDMHILPGTEIPLKVTYHPAYLLRNPSAKAIAWQDLKLLHRLLQ